MKHTIWENYDVDLDDWKDMFEELNIEPNYEDVYETLEQYLDDERANLNVQLNNPIVEFGAARRWDGTVNGFNIIDSGNIRDILEFHKDCEYAKWYSNGTNICSVQTHHDGSNHYTYRQLIDGMDLDEFEEKVYTESGRVNMYALLKYTKSILPDVAKVYGWEYGPEIEKREQVEALTEVGEWKGCKEAVDKFNDPDYKGVVNDFGTVTFGNNFYEISCQDHSNGEVVFHIDQYVPLDEYCTHEIDNTKNFKFKITPEKRDVLDFVKPKDYIRLEFPDDILKDFYEFKKAIVSEMVEHGMVDFKFIDGYQELKLDGKGYLKNLEMAIHDYPRTLAHKDKLTTEEYDYLAEHYVEAVLKYEAEYMQNVKKWREKDPRWDNIHKVNTQEGNEKAIKNMIFNDFKDSRILILADKMNTKLKMLGKKIIDINVLKDQLASPFIKRYREEHLAAHNQSSKAK